MNMQAIIALALLIVCTFAHLNHHTHPERRNITMEKQLYVKHPFHGIEENINSPVTVNAVI
jgi:hypothetical protein